MLVAGRQSQSPTNPSPPAALPGRSIPADAAPPPHPRVITRHRCCQPPTPPPPPPTRPAGSLTSNLASIPPACSWQGFNSSDPARPFWDFTGVNTSGVPPSLTIHYIPSEPEIGPPRALLTRQFECLLPTNGVDTLIQISFFKAYRPLDVWRECGMPALGLFITGTENVTAWAFGSDSFPNRVAAYFKCATYFNLAGPQRGMRTEPFSVRTAGEGQWYTIVMEHRPSLQVLRSYLVAGKVPLGGHCTADILQQRKLWMSNVNTTVPTLSGPTTVFFGHTGPVTGWYLQPGYPTQLTNLGVAWGPDAPFCAWP